MGTIAPGAFADVLVVDGNPLDDINLLAEPRSHVRMVVKTGRVVIDR
jgi:imidazolonepropionase-like amidohydrolase